MAGNQVVWIIALIPAIVASVILFGVNSLRIICLAVASSLIFDALANKLVPSRDVTENFTSVTMAILLSFVMPFNAPWWLIIVGCFLMIVVGKKLFGGTGAYPVHPVMLSAAMLYVSWPSRFDYTSSILSLDWSVKLIEPVRYIKTVGAELESAYNLYDLFLGKQAAGIGNALVLYLLIGGLLLILLRKISWQIPVFFIIGNLVMASILHYSDPVQYASPMFYLLSGGTVFAAFFLAPEYTTSPVNRVPMMLYGFLGGVLLILIRAFSVHNDGVIFTILLINICSPLLDRIRPKVYGVEKGTSYA